MGWLRTLLTGTDGPVSLRDTVSTPYRMVGFPSDGGLVSAGVTGTTALGLSAVWRSLDILANGVSQLDWQEWRGDSVPLPVSRIVKRPQAERTRREWTSLVVSTLALYDVCYLLKVGGDDTEGVPMGLWPIDPSLISPVTFDYFTLLPPAQFYLGGTTAQGGAQIVDRDQLVILHRSPQPSIQDTLGGIIKLARSTMAAAIAAENYASRYWQSGGSPTTVLETDAKLMPGAATEMQDRWRESRARGPDFAAVLENGIKAKPFGADPMTQAAVEARRELVADIGRYFGIPTRILNAPTGDSETYHTSEAGNQDLVRYTLANYVGALEDAITDLLPGGRRMRMDTEPLIRGVQLNRYQAYAFALGNKAWLTPEDVRAAEGYPPVEDPAELNPTPAPVSVAPGGNQDGQGSSSAARD